MVVDIFPISWDRHAGHVLGFKQFSVYAARPRNDMSYIHLMHVLLLCMIFPSLHYIFYTTLPFISCQQKKIHINLYYFISIISMVIIHNICFSRKLSYLFDRILIPMKTTIDTTPPTPRIMPLYKVALLFVQAYICIVKGVPILKHIM